MDPITREEQYLSAIAGLTAEVPEKPLTRTEALLAAILENGGGGGGGGGESTIAWKPAVDAEGNLSWSRSSSTTKPATQNIKGEKGDAGATGEKGDTGEKGADGAKGDKGDDGYSPTIAVTGITGGHRVTVTDATGSQSFDVMNGSGGGGTSDFNDLTNRPKYLGDAMTNKTDVMGFELIEDHDGCYWYDDAYTWMGAWKKTPSGGATGHGMVVSRGQREIGLIKGDAGSSSSQRWRIPMADKVEDMLAEKADKATTYTKAETDGKIAEAMTDVDNEHFHPVTALPSPTDEDPTKRPKENHEYVVIEYEQDGTTIKSETHYLFYGGAYHQKSTGGVSLDGYATEDFVNNKTANMGEFDVTPIPQGPTGANEINTVLSNKDNEYTRLSYVRQSDGALPSTVNLGVKSGLGEDSFELPTKALVDTKQDALTTGQGARIKNNIIDTPLLDEIPAIGNRSSFYDDHFYESVKQSNTVYTAKYKSAEDRQVVYNADLTDYYWRVKYENNTEEFIELRNRRITQAGGTTDVARYDAYKIFTDEPYKHVTPDIMWIDIVQNAEAQYVFGTYGKSYTTEQMGHPRAMSMTPYAKTMIKKLSDIVKTDLFLQGIIEEKGSSWGVAKAGKVRFVFASPTTTICDLNIDISELGLTSTNDYVIQMTISGGGNMDWGASELWTWGGSATSIGVTCRNDINKNNDFVDVDYVIVAKGFGGGSGGSGGGTVDQTYDATSTNAQSGTAVAQAVNKNYVVDKPEGSQTKLGSVVQVGSFVFTDGAEYGIYEFYYRTSALPAADTTKSYPLTPLLNDYTVFDFIDATGMTSNGHFIGSGRTDGANRIIVQQFSKNSKNFTMRSYGDFTQQTALLKIKFIGTKNV